MTTYGFLFDLDGTLIISDDIYFNVWKTILSDYNIILTDELFKKYIQCNNDKYVLNTLLANININLEDLSEKKDKLFIENINNLIIIDGAIEFIKKIKEEFNYPCCIVTNCNKNVAKFIIKYLNLDSYIDLIISSNDCILGKPNPEPYLNAMNKLHLFNDNCLIFEDSKTGILSAMGINPKCIIGIETLYSNNELMNYGANITIRNYIDLNINDLINYDNFNNDSIKKKIIENSLLSIKDVEIFDTKLKGGYIADVINIIIHTKNKKYNCVLKMENKSTTMLSYMANKLDLYEREYYFYENISKYVNINVPRFFSLMKDKDYNNCGVILENLAIKPNFKINLNLNEEPIEVSLKIIDNMAKMHSKFWNKNLKKIFPKLRKNNDPIFKNFNKNFLTEKIDLFKDKWSNILSEKDLKKCDFILNDYNNIQDRLSDDNLTLVHGDIKSPNIFYDMFEFKEPYFLDWQHCVHGKGAQDLIFFIIESFDAKYIYILYDLFKGYYYKKLVEYGVINYSIKEYNDDLKDALYYIPFFTAVWFGSVPNDELIDKNWIYFFIQKLFIVINQF